MKRPYKLVLTAVQGDTFGAGAESRRVLGTYSSAAAATAAKGHLCRARPDLAFRASVQAPKK